MLFQYVTQYSLYANMFWPNHAIIREYMPSVHPVDGMVLLKDGVMWILLSLIVSAFSRYLNENSDSKCMQ